MALLFISNVVPDKEEYWNTAFNRSGNNVELGIASNLPQDTELWSCPALPSFPRGRLFYRGRKVELENGRNISILPALNLKFIKSIFWGILCFNRIILWRLKHWGEDCVVLTYNNDPPPFEYLLAACRITGSKLFTILYDLGVPPATLKISRMTRLAYHYTDKVAHYVIKRLDGRIIINERIAKDYAPQNNYLLIDGGIGNNIIERLFPLKLSSNRNLVLVLAGMLWEQNGTALVLNTLKQHPELNVKVIFAGKGQDVSDIINEAKSDSRIEYKGMLSPDELFRVYETADVLLNLRIEDTVDYHFPSKLLEYLVTGKVVISTPVAHAERDYGRFLSILNPATPESLSSLLKEIMNIDKETLFRKGVEQRNYMIENRTWEVRTKEIIAYISSNKS